MTRPTAGFLPPQMTVVRSGGGIAVDNATLTDVNIDPTVCLDCTGLDSIFVGPEITGGSSPTMAFEALFRDADAADGLRYKRILQGVTEGVTLGAAAAQTTPALLDGQLAELRVYGHPKVWVRVTAVTNAGSTTAWKILAMPGRVRPKGTADHV